MDSSFRARGKMHQQKGCTWIRHRKVNFSRLRNSSEQRAPQSAPFLVKAAPPSLIMQKVTSYASGYLRRTPPCLWSAWPKALLCPPLMCSCLEQDESQRVRKPDHVERKPTKAGENQALSSCNSYRTRMELPHLNQTSGSGIDSFIRSCKQKLSILELVLLTGPRKS